MYIKKILVSIAIIGVVVCGIWAYSIYNTIFSVNTAFENEKAFVFIPSDATFEDVVEELSPLLKDVDAFKEVAKRKGYTTRVKGGHYVLTKGMNTNDIINAIRNKSTPIKVAFNNQERIQNLAGRIARQIEADSLSLVNAMTDPDFLDANGFNMNTAMSMYIPDSYELYWNSTAEDFRERMLRFYKRFWNATRTQKANELGLTPQQVYTLAAIVQKETAKVDERPRVAGVYINRLKIGMKLDADPTVIYALKKKNNDWGLVVKRVLYKDLEIDSPYNTYRNTGLPPGPIFMPDVSAIDAVLNYEKHGYYYFVADVNNFGYHKFAKTLAQHNANSEAYRWWINKQGIRR